MIYSILCTVFFWAFPDMPATNYVNDPDRYVVQSDLFWKTELEEEEVEEPTLVSSNVFYYYNNETQSTEICKVEVYSVDGNLIRNEHRLARNVLPYISFIPDYEIEEMVETLEEDITEFQELSDKIEEIEDEIACLSCVLTAKLGRIKGPSGEETYYNLNMSRCVERIQSLGYEGEYWVRDDGVKMFGDYVMVAADFSTRPLGTLLETSLGTGIVVDTGTFVESNPTQIDIAVDW